MRQSRGVGGMFLLMSRREKERTGGLCIFASKI